MKTFLKINIAIIGTFLGLSLTSAQAEASAIGKCYIYLTAPCHNHLGAVKPGAYFLDSDRSAQRDATRCSRRAAEYYAWCGDPSARQVVYSAFNVNPAGGGEFNVQSTVKSATQSYITGPLQTVIGLGQ